MKKNDQMQDAVNRRTFLGQSSGVIGTSMLGSMALNHGVFAAQNDELKIALIGCGGRGSGAADQALNTHDQGPIKLVAMADAFFYDHCGPSHAPWAWADWPRGAAES